MVNEFCLCIHKSDWFVVFLSGLRFGVRAMPPSQAALGGVPSACSFHERGERTGGFYCLSVWWNEPVTSPGLSEFLF